MVPDKIKPKGTVSLGTELVLERRLEVPESSRQALMRVRYPDRARPEVVGPRSMMRGDSVQQRRYEYGFKLGTSPVAFEDYGLCQAYGVFGQPGRGKSNLLKVICDQLLHLHPDDPTVRFGGLFLDPKGTLVEDLKEVAKTAGRELVVVSDSGDPVNVLDCFLEPFELGKALSLAVKSAGIDSKEPFWLNQMGTVLGAGLQLLDALRHETGKRPTLASLAELILATNGDGELATLMKWGERTWLAPDDQVRLSMAVQTLRRFQQSKDRPILENFVEQSLGPFRDPKCAAFSALTPPDTRQRNLYDAIIDEGALVVVSLSARRQSVARVLCTVIKSIFQQAVLTRRARVLDKSDSLTNFTRPLIFVADEYSDVATEIPGHPMGDARFFSQARQFGCMCLVATQHIHMLMASGLRDVWKAIFANLAAKVFLPLGDADTAKVASELAGESEYLVELNDVSFNRDGVAISHRRELRMKPDLPTRVLLQAFETGCGVVVGALDGRSRNQVRFLDIEYYEDMKRERSRQSP